MTISNIVLAFTAISNALIAGLFYSYSCSVIIGLGRLQDAEYVSAMQSINRAIQNPVFFITFFGTLILLPLSTYLNYSQPIPLSFWLLLIATIVYFLGVFGVTALGNIPLNNTLDKFNHLTASKEAISLQRTIFESKWNNLNTIRTIASILSLILVIIACLHSNNSNLTTKE